MHEVTMFVTEIRHPADIAHTQPPQLRCLCTDMPVDGPNCLTPPRLEPLESVIRNVFLPALICRGATSVESVRIGSLQLPPSVVTTTPTQPISLPHLWLSAGERQQQQTSCPARHQVIYPS